MKSKRTEIRKKIVELLKGQTEAEDQVFDSRLPPVNSSNYPCILVYSLNEDVTTLDKAQGLKRYDLALTIEVFADSPEETLAAELLDTISDKVEAIIENSDKLNGLVKDIGIDGGELALYAEGESALASWKIKIDCCYIKTKGV